jgi:hypothetical protein
MSIRLTFEVDQIQLFDTLKKLDGDWSFLGNRLVEVMLGGEAGFRDAIGMAMYGITLVTEPQAQGESEEERSDDTATTEHSSASLTQKSETPDE